MIDIIKKVMLTGVGLALVAKDEIEELAKEMVEKGKMSETEGIKFLKEIQGKYDDAQAKLEDRVDKSVKEFMKKAGVVTKDELKALKKEIRDLKKAISEGADKPE